MAFPSPALNYTENRINLNDLLRLSPHSHYLMKCGQDYPLAGILKGALLIIDRALTPKDTNIVIAEINGGLELRRLHLHNQASLVSLKVEHDVLRIKQDEPLPTWGIVSYSINDLAGIGFNHSESTT